MRWDLLFKGLRWLVALVLLAPIPFIGKSLNKLSGLDPAAGVLGLVACALLALAVLVLMPDLLSVVAAPIYNFFNDLFYPRTEIGGEAPNYNLARYYRKQRRFDEAIVWYWRILAAHPQELDAYLEGMSASFEAHDPRKARRFCRAGLRALKNAAARKELEQWYEVMRANAARSRNP